MLLLTPGPVQTDPRVRAAAAADIAPWDEDFRAEYAAIREAVVRIAGGAPGEHCCLPLQGAGHFVVEAAIRTFVPPGGSFVVPLNGAYGERIRRLGAEAGRVPIPIPVPDTRAVTAAEVEHALRAHPDATHLVAVHSETGSGIVNDPDSMGRAARAAGRRMILDGVSGFGALPFRLSEHPEVDAVVFTSNKCLEGLPGFGFAVCPADRTRARAGTAGSWSLDLGDVLLHAERSGWGSFRFTPPVQALRAFGAAIALYDAEGGQPARLARYRENSRLLLEGGAALGLRPYLDPAEQGPIIATFHQPPGLDLQALVDALKRRGVLISNFWTTAEPTIRIGCIGAVTPDDVRGAVASLGEALREVGAAERAAA